MPAACSCFPLIVTIKSFLSRLSFRPGCSGQIPGSSDAHTGQGRMPLSPRSTKKDALLLPVRPAMIPYTYTCAGHKLTLYCCQRARNEPARRIAKYRSSAIFQLSVQRLRMPVGFLQRIPAGMRNPALPFRLLPYSQQKTGRPRSLLFL